MDRATLSQHVAQCIDRAKRDRRAYGDTHDGAQAGYREAASLLDTPTDDLSASLSYHIQSADRAYTRALAGTGPVAYCSGRLIALQHVLAQLPLPA